VTRPPMSSGSREMATPGPWEASGPPAWMADPDRHDAGAHACRAFHLLTPRRGADLVVAHCRSGPLLIASRGRRADRGTHPAEPHLAQAGLRDALRANRLPLGHLVPQQRESPAGGAGRDQQQVIIF
jgi:hypothetical protein